MLLEEFAAFGAAAAGLPQLVLDAWERYDAAESSVAARRSILGAQILGVLELVLQGLSPPRLRQLATVLCSRIASLTLPADEVRCALRVIDRLQREGGSSQKAELTAWRSTLWTTLETSLLAYVRGGQPSVGLETCVFMFGELGLEASGSVSASICLGLKSISAKDGALVSCTPVLRGHAIIALGKLCLQREQLAKQTVELFVCHLLPQEPLLVRNNALLVLGDLCMRYTSLVDRFLPAMADLLRDPSQLLRKQAAMVMSALLSENYVKFRGPFMYRFIYGLTDPAPAVRHIIECTCKEILHRQSPTFFMSIFVDLVCTLNGWAGHAAYQGAVGNDAFSLRHDDHRRLMVYGFLLPLLSMEQKLSHPEGKGGAPSNEAEEEGKERRKEGKDRGIQEVGRRRSR